MLKGFFNYRNIYLYLIALVLILVATTKIQLASSKNIKQSDQKDSLSSVEKLAYIYKGDLWIKALSDKEPKQLTTSADVSTPQWSRSGKWIAFRKGNSVSIISPTDSKIIKVNNGNSVCGFAWSPTEDLLAYRTKNRSWFTLDPNNSNTKKIVLDDGDLACEKFYDNYAKSMWSSDGKYFSYVKEKIISQSKTQGITKLLDTLWLVDVKTARATNFYQTNHPIFIAKWLADSKYILIWQSLDTFPSASLLADGLPLKAVPINKGKNISISEETLLNPEFTSSSPDSKYLVWVEGSGRETYQNKQISIMNLTSEKKSILTEEKMAATSPIFSPNGEYIAFVGGKDVGNKIQNLSEDGYQKETEKAINSRRIWVMKKDGTDKHALTTDSEYGDLFPQWSNDGKNIFFIRKNKDSASIYSININSQNLKLLVNELSPLDNDSYYGYMNLARYFDFSK